MLTADYVIGEGKWGNNIEFVSPEEFQENNLENNLEFSGKWYQFFKRLRLYRVWGCVPIIRPQVGETLVGNFKNSYVKFRFVNVEYKSDPPDMFFADVVPIEQEWKN
jgi:hypothetical protein